MSPPLPATLVTPRLVLSRARLGDGPALGEALTETLDDLAPWFRWAETLQRWGDADDLAARARVSEQRFLHERDPTFHAWDRAQPGRLLGEVALFSEGWRYGVLELTFWVRRSAWGRGFAREATGALLEAAFRDAGAQHVAAETDGRNARSRCLLQHLGFDRYGLAQAGERWVRDGVGAAVRAPHPVGSAR